ncbi:hypothetical protein [Streptomyces sp. IB201691-2A2]|uniref:hypothetical protein n=1 Tax=Streptomyces sp. IB201691-2A2 TaxID=2561920 RepID=UPI00117F6F33|nr:hypothetical protein [Streptomyces sp. IB201691-2A2]TRO55959.1 hypothetical protein E4K73_48545 [Streptomyces sp. IB201691-2A2]
MIRLSSVSGSFFLAGKPHDDSVAAERWGAIEDDLGALVSFFDLVVMHEQLPAFNYYATFDAWHDFRDPLGELLNTHGDKTLVHVDVEHSMYREVKEAAVHQLSSRLEAGSLVHASVGQEILSTLAAVQYQWEPSLETLEPQLADDADQVKIARFLLGQLVFAGYAQQTGAPQVLAPKRSRMLTAVGLGVEDARPSAEAAIYHELSRRFREAGEGWRDVELPWTPSFMPFLLKHTRRYREGPDVLLDAAKELRDKKAIQRYRKLQEALVSEEAENSTDARKELSAAADAVAKSLDSTREEMHFLRRIAVEVLPEAVGAAGGAVVGAVAAGPPGAAVGALAGFVAEDVLRAVNNRLWGWVIDELPYRSARKLLTRSTKAEYDLGAQLVPHLRTVWDTGRRAG